MAINQPALTEHRQGNNEKHNVVGKVIRAQPGADNVIHLKESHGALKSVDVADVDLVLGFADGTYIVIPNGALDAIAGSPHKVEFSDSFSASTYDLFKQVGHIDAADAGNLRIISENIDTKLTAAGESDIDITSLIVSLNSLSTNTSALPAPLPKAASISSSGIVGKSGGGRFDTEALDTVVPTTITQPTAYRVATRVSSVSELDIGIPAITGDLYVSSEYKLDFSSGVTTEGVVPVGSLSATAESQAHREVVTGTSGDDTISYNTAFTASESDWAKTLSMVIAGFTTVTSVTITAYGLSSTTNLSISGVGITQVDATHWTLTGTAASLAAGIDLLLTYALQAADDSFTLEVEATGKVSGVTLVLSKVFNFDYTNAQVQADYAAVTTNGDTIMVLPSQGVGYNINGGAGNDYIYAAAGYDSVLGGAGDDTLYGAAGNDTLRGDDPSAPAVGGDDSIDGGAGDDLLEGGVGADTLIGGTGTDTATYANAATAVVVNLIDNTSGNTATIGVAQSGDAAGDVFSGIENITGSAFNDLLIGDSLANVLKGGGGNDTLEGLDGADQLVGSTDGNNSASYAHADTGVTATLTSTLATAIGDAAGDTYTNIQNLIGSNYADLLIGDTNANRLTGGTGDDTLEGVGGTTGDTLDGGGGTDTASYADATAAVIASLSAGTGVISGKGTDTFIYIENLTGSSYADKLTGDSGTNVLNGGLSNDTLEGLGGADTLIGGSGTDTASYASATSAVVVNLTDNDTSNAGSNSLGVTQFGDAYGDVFSGIENIIGSDYSDLLVGNSSDNSIASGSGDDTLEGMAGADTLDGGDGSNTATYEHANSAVVASLTLVTTTGFGNVTITGDAVGDTYSNIQNLTGSTYADQLIGDANANTLTGGSGKDTLEGMAGPDALIGGDDIDTASYQHASTGVIALLDTVSGATFTSSGDAAGDTYSGIENLLGSSYNDTLVGDSGNNSIAGGDGADLLVANGGNDTLVGGAGDDTLVGGSGTDSLSGGTGTDIASYRYSTIAVTASLVSLTGTAGDAAGDTYVSIEGLEGGSGDDSLIGDSNANTLIGGAGNDTLIGGVGDDVIAGGDGVDTTSFAGLAKVTVVLDASGNGTATSASGNDTLTSIESLIGTDTDDSFTLGVLPKASTGGVIDGGTGTDTVIYSVGTTQVVANLATGAVNDASGNSVSGILTGIENITAAGGDDSLTGTSTANALTGGSGDDTLIGAGGADTLAGGTGVDTASFVGLAAVTVVLNASGNGSATGTSGTVALTGIENVIGTSNDDSITLSVLPTATTGGTTGGMIDGGSGTDTLIYSVNTTSVVADLSTGIVNNVTVLSNIENLTSASGNDTLTGDGNANILTASAGNDSLSGGAGNDTLYGGTGIDTIYGGADNDFIYGGNDSLGTDTGANTIYGGQGNDTIYGGNNGNTIYGDDDSIAGSGGGNDSISGGSSADTIYGGDGDDILSGLGGADSLYGGLGNDLIYGGSGTAGTDTGANTIYGGLGSDTIYGGNSGNIIYGGNDGVGGDADGGDYIVGGTSADTIYGGDGNDTLTGLAGVDYLYGGSGTNTARYTTAVTVTLTAGLVAMSGDSTVTGGSITNAGTEAAGDVFSNIQNITVTTGASTIIGDTNANYLTGGTGNDTIEGLGGTDTIDGGAGSDYLTFIHSTASTDAVNANLVTGIATLTGTYTGTYTLLNIENLIGTYGNDTLTGNDTANAIYGAAGNDFIIGGNGADSLYGGAGNDIIYGGTNTSGTDTGANSIVGGAGADLIYGGNSGNTIYGDDTASSATGAGNDTIYGGTGADTIVSGYGDDSIVGGAGNDNLQGGYGNDTIDATLGKDTVTGSVGNDTIYASVLTGNVFNSIAGSDATNQAVDTDTLILSGFTTTSTPTYALSTLTNTNNIVTYIDKISIQGDTTAVATAFTADAASIQSVVGNGASSVLTLLHGTEDSINITLTSSQTLTTTTVSSTETDYSIYTSGVLTASLHWVTA